MTKSITSQFRLWRNRGGFYQINGRKEVLLPERTPVKLPRRQLTRVQRQCIINWRWG